MSVKDFMTNYKVSKAVIALRGVKNERSRTNTSRR